ncbi:hypothetical protein K438DRAFT_1835086 [Mycena galopus ATCC 62051]|nr:hypothetical protein K438DRAFT_1835086 [Mycena galopus ATCC 62051]
MGLRADVPRSARCGYPGKGEGPHGQRAAGVWRGGEGRASRHARGVIRWRYLTARYWCTRAQLHVFRVSSRLGVSHT